MNSFVEGGHDCQNPEPVLAILLEMDYGITESVFFTLHVLM